MNPPIAEKTASVGTPAPRRKNSNKKNKTWTRWIAPSGIPGVRSIAVGLFQVARASDKHVLLTDRSLRGDLFRSAVLGVDRVSRKLGISRDDLCVRWWPIEPTRITRQLQIVRKHEREKAIPLDEWSDYLQLFCPGDGKGWEYPTTTIFPRSLYGLYEVYFRWRGDYILLYAGLSGDCLRKRLLRHFQEPDPYDEYGWFCPPGSPHIFARFKRLRLNDLEEAEHFLIKHNQPPCNRDRKDRPYQPRLFGRHNDDEHEEIPF